MALLNNTLAKTDTNTLWRVFRCYYCCTYRSILLAFLDGIKSLRIMLNVCIDSIQSELLHNAVNSLEALQIVFLVHTKCGMEHRSKKCSDVI